MEIQGVSAAQPAEGELALFLQAALARAHPTPSTHSVNGSTPPGAERRD